MAQEQRDPAHLASGNTLVVHSIRIFLADDEWTTPLMRQLAQEYACLHSQRPLVVQVHEHAGWSLAWAFDTPEDVEGVIVGTANDMAVFSKKEEELREKYFHAQWEYFPEVRRQSKTRKVARPANLPTLLRC